MDRLRAAHFGKLRSTDNVPVPADTELEIVSIALLVARAVRYLGGETLGAKSE
jgi:hypothetical protein